MRLSIDTTGITSHLRTKLKLHLNFLSTRQGRHSRLTNIFSHYIAGLDLQNSKLFIELEQRRYREHDRESAADVVQR